MPMIVICRSRYAGRRRFVDSNMAFGPVLADNTLTPPARRIASVRVEACRIITKSRPPDVVNDQTAEPKTRSTHPLRSRWRIRNGLRADRGRAEFHVR